MTTNLSLGNQVVVTTQFYDANNLPLQGFGGEITWSVDTPGVVIVKTANDNVSAIIIAQNMGIANVTASLGSLSLIEEFVVNTPASGILQIGPPSGANSVIGRV